MKHVWSVRIRVSGVQLVKQYFTNALNVGITSLYSLLLLMHLYLTEGFLCLGRCGFSGMPSFTWPINVSLNYFIHRFIVAALTPSSSSPSRRSQCTHISCRVRVRTHCWVDTHTLVVTHGSRVFNYKWKMPAFRHSKKRFQRQTARCPTTPDPHQARNVLPELSRFSFKIKFKWMVSAAPPPSTQTKCTCTSIMYELFIFMFLFFQ